MPAFCLSQSARATAIGLFAPVSWGMSVGLIRRITEDFGLAAGLALLYLATCAFLFFLPGLRPRLSSFPKKYLLFGMPLANIYSIFFCLSLYLSDGGRQTVEVGMVNYLWPCLVVLFAVLFNGQKARWWLWPGVVISFIGIMLVMGGEGGVDIAGIAQRFRHNPWSYMLAFFGAVCWGAYTNFTRAWSDGNNPTLYVFAIDSVTFSCMWAAGMGSIGGGSAMGWLSVGLGAVAMGGSYAAWCYGVTRGNITILAVSSYFTPALSCLFAMMWLGASLGSGFWKGVAVLILGSLLCWSSTALRR